MEAGEIEEEDVFIDEDSSPCSYRAKLMYRVRIDNTFASACRSASVSCAFSACTCVVRKNVSEFSVLSLAINYSIW